MAVADVAPSKSFLTQKMGPLPTWAWMGLGLGGALVISVARKNKAGAPVGTTSTLGGTNLPGNVVPQYTFVDESSVNTSVNLPPGAGRPPDAPPPPPVAQGPGLLSDPFQPPPGTYTSDFSGFTDAGTSWINSFIGQWWDSGTPNPAGEYVTVDRGNMSDLNGIAEAIYGPTQWDASTGQQMDVGRSRSDWLTIAEAPQNNDVLLSRWNPDTSNYDLQPGDKIWVPGNTRTP